MKEAFILFWRGLTGILAGIANWFTEILGMKDNSKYGKLLRRTVGTCFALLMTLFTLVVVIDAAESLQNRFRRYFDNNSNEPYKRKLSQNVFYLYHGKPGKKDYVADLNGNKLIENVVWVARPLGYDSLCCYSDGKKRGYFNIFTGEVVISPKYDHAWIFSDGLAAVEENGKIKFIDQTGKTVIDNGMKFDAKAEGYVFHYGYCVVPHGKERKYGLIDRTGKWAVTPVYDNITPTDSLWLMRAGGKEGIMKADSMKFIIPMSDIEIASVNNWIYIKGRDNRVSLYEKNGRLIDDSHIGEVKPLLYKTDKVCYNTRATYDEDGNELTRETDYENPHLAMSMANRSAYSNGFGEYGLITENGEIVTMPLYKDIQALASDVYLCHDTEGHGILIDSNGKRIK